jgi:HK97 gp10 family phage protein
MADGGIKVIGLDETIKALQAIGTPTKAIAAAGVESARIVAAEAKTLVPRNTGTLANTIKPSRTKHGSRIVAGGPNAPYGLPIHWGWFRDTKSPRALASPKGYIARNIKPNSFLSRALGYTKQQVVDTYRKNMNKLIEQETAKARRGR